MINIAESITVKLTSTFAPERLRLVNESADHSGPATDSHYNAIIVAEAFAPMGRVARQRAVYACLAEEMAGPVHALTMKTLTPAEWEAAGGEVSNPAPKCRGGSE
jgi:BolA protein